MVFLTQTNKFENSIKKIIINSITWCSIGITNEVIFTAISDYFSIYDNKLIGYTYLWMIPIYSLLPVIFWISDKIIKNIFIKSLFVSLNIMFFELLYGSFLKKYFICPWEKNYISHYSINNVVRLDYFPFWYMISLIWSKLWIEFNNVTESTTKYKPKSVSN